MTQLPLSRVLSLCASSAFGQGIDSTDVNGLRAVEPKDESELIRLLTEHRLQLLFWEAVRKSNSEEALSRQARDWFVAARRDALIRAALFENALLVTSRALADAQLGVVACKGIVLSQHYYPARGLRRMHDIDYWLIDPDEDACRAALKTVGFVERKEKANTDALNFIGPSEVVLDVHVRMSLFEGHGQSLRTLSQPQAGLDYSVFVPEAMIAHLVTHLLGHASQTGILMCWIIDVALVLRRHSVDPNRIKQLLRDDGRWIVFLRLVKTFAQLGWIEHTMGLQSQLTAVRAVDWDILARQRRRSCWSGVRGKLKLGKTLVMRPSDHAPLPRLLDVVWQPLDWLREQSAWTAGVGAMLIPRSDD